MDEMRNIVLIWLDDLRNPLDFVNSSIYDMCDVVWVKNYNEFVLTYDKYKNEYNIYMSLDHDLGEEKDGYDCLKYVGEDCMNEWKELPHIEIHSSNPVGRNNMESYIKSYNKVMNLRKKIKGI